MKISTKCGYTIMELLVALLLIGIVAAVLVPVFSSGGDRRNPGASCRSNLKQLGLAMIQYTQDNDEKFPPLALHAVASSNDAFSKTPYGWADAIQPYAKSTQILQCPSEANQMLDADVTQSGFTDYWFNTNLDAVQMDKISAPYATFLLGEGNDGRNFTDARYHRGALPTHWLDDESSPSYRHLDTANYLYADGHVKMLTPKYIVSSDSFAVQRR